MKKLQKKCLEIQERFIPDAKNNDFAMNLFLIEKENYRLMDKELGRIRSKRIKQFKEILGDIVRLDNSILEMQKELPLFPSESKNDEPFLTTLDSFRSQVLKMSQSFHSKPILFHLLHYPRTPSTKFGLTIKFTGKERQELVVSEDWKKAQLIYLENRLNQLGLILKKNKITNIPEVITTSLIEILPQNTNERFATINKESIRKKLESFNKKKYIDELLESNCSKNKREKSETSLFKEIEKIDSIISKYGWK